jgi:hypothetical protein
LLPAYPPYKSWYEKKVVDSRESSATHNDDGLRNQNGKPFENGVNNMRRFFSCLIGTVFALSTLNVFADNLLSHSVAQSAMSQNAQQENTRDSKDAISKDGASKDVGKDSVSDTSSSKDGASSNVGKDTGSSSKDGASTDVGKDTGSSKDGASSDVGKSDDKKDTDCGKDGCQSELRPINSVLSVNGKVGSLSDSTVQFSAGISINDGTFELTNNSVKQNTDRFTIKGTITPEAEQIGKPADIIVVAFHRPDPDNLSCDPTVEPDGSGYYMFTSGESYLDNYCIWDVDTPEADKHKYDGVKLPQRYGDGKSICRPRGTRSAEQALWQRWQGNLKTLTPLFFDMPLQAQTTLSLYEDTPPYIGHVCLYFGYWLSASSCQNDDSNCRLIFNGDPIEFSVHE